MREEKKKNKKIEEKKRKRIEKKRFLPLFPKYFWGFYDVTSRKCSPMRDNNPFLRLKNTPCFL